MFRLPRGAGIEPLRPAANWRGNGGRGEQKQNVSLFSPAPAGIVRGLGVREHRFPDHRVVDARKRALPGRLGAVRVASLPDCPASSEEKPTHTEHQQRYKIQKENKNQKLQVHPSTDFLPSHGMGGLWQKQPP